MYKRKGIKLLTITILAALMTSCSGYQKMIKSGDHDAIFAEAMRLYENGSYAKTLQLFDRIAVFVKGTDKEEPLNYYYAQCYYNMGDYLLASYYFRKYVRQYPISDKAEECAFLSALSKYKQSPNSSLDQTATRDAIQEMQIFINGYPNSPRVEECNEYIDEMRAKLEEKDYNIAMLYMRMEEYKAAMVCFNNILKDYPETDHKEEILYCMVKAGHNYAVNSVESKQKERFKQVVEDYQKFILTYPNSPYTREIEHFYKTALNHI